MDHSLVLQRPQDEVGFAPLETAEDFPAEHTNLTHSWKGQGVKVSGLPVPLIAPPPPPHLLAVFGGEKLEKALENYNSQQAPRQRDADWCCQTL